MNSLESLSKEFVYYLASPYTSPSAYIREERYLAVVKVASDLINQGFTLIEPIAMSHHHAQRFGLPSGYEFWKKRDRTFIERCDAVLVCMLEGWKESIGVNDEIQYARTLGKPVFFLQPFTLTLDHLEF